MLRSFLFVPAKPNMLGKIGSLGADAYIIDLEDSIEAEKKEEALCETEHFLRSYDFSASVFVRLNGETFEREAERLKVFSKLGFMLPKFENVSFYDAFSPVWKAHPVIALVETPGAIVNIQEIAKCDWVDVIAFGAEDYTSMANMENSPDMLMYQKSRLLTYAKAYGKYALDTPSFRVDSIKDFENETQMAVRMGFDGKMAISPKHIEYINSSFVQMSRAELENIIEQYEAAGKAVQMIDGKVYEKMHINRLKKLLSSDYSS